MMRATYDPFRELDALRREVDRAFEGYTGPRWVLPFSRYSFLPGRAARAYPLMNIREDADNYHVEALAPGIDPESLQVAVHGDTLTIAGEKKPSDPTIGREHYHRVERAAGRFARELTLPHPVDEVQVTATYRNGVVSLRLPKTADAKPRQISVNIA